MLNPIDYLFIYWFLYYYLYRLISVLQEPMNQRTIECALDRRFLVRL